MSRTLIAPVYSLRRDRWRMNASGGIRVPSKHVLAEAQLRNAQPFFLNVFDQTLGALQSGEDAITVQWRMWLVAIMASVTQGSLVGSNQPFGLQLFYNRTDPQTQEQSGGKFQLFPIDAGNYLGTGQKPGYLRKPKFLDDGTELLARVQNLQAASNAIQIVLLCYIPGGTVKL